MSAGDTTDLARAPSAWARVAARLVRWAAGRGADRATLVSRAGLSEDVLHDLDGRVPLVALYELLELASAMLSDPLLGLRFTTSLTIEDIDAIGFLIITSTTLRQAVERVSRYQRVFNDGERFELDVVGDHAPLVWTGIRPWTALAQAASSPGRIQRASAPMSVGSAIHHTS
jgi:hypothetical protein